MNKTLNKQESIRIQESSNCIGCGLCPVVFKDSCEMYFGDDGTYKIKFNKPINDDQFSNLCPVVNNAYITKDIWGEIKNAYLSYANNADIRYKGSSGGVITALAIYLLEKHMVDGIIQVRSDDQYPLKNMVQISRTKQDVLNCCGSRYAPVSVFDSIYSELRKDESYCLIGKPCDIRAFKNYMRQFPTNLKQIKYTLSFFCAGVPSKKATEEVLTKLGVKKDEVVRFDYRGNGWPGFTQAKCKDGSCKKMEYNESWGAILGRHLHSGCKFCVDGVGVSADIACGDAWFSDEKGYPVFSEADGRNIVLIRSKKGQDIFNNAVNDGYIACDLVGDVTSFLAKIQPYQYKRKALMYTKVRMLRLFKKYTPKYDKMLKVWDKQVPLKDKIIYAKGTVERIVKNRIK